MKKIYILIPCIILIITICIAIFGNKSLDPSSEEISKLYKTLGQNDISFCGGLNTYTSLEIKAEDIPLENRLCMAYYELDSNKITENTLESNLKGENKTPLCKVGEDITFAANDEAKCPYKTINQDDLNNAYKKLYGKDIPNYLKFNITTTEACLIEEGTYYCGTTEKFDVTLTPDTNVYRLINKVLKSFSGEIIIEDYYLRIADNKCYKSNSLVDENEACTKALAAYEDFNNETDKEKKSFIKKYGQKYRHVFKENDNNYYWYKSYQK